MQRPAADNMQRVRDLCKPVQNGKYPSNPDSRGKENPDEEEEERL